MHLIIKTYSICLLKNNQHNIHMMGSILISNLIDISCEFHICPKYAAKFLDVRDLFLFDQDSINLVQFDCFCV